MTNATKYRDDDFCIYVQRNEPQNANNARFDDKLRQVYATN